MTVLQFLQATYFSNLTDVVILIIAFSIFLLSIKDEIQKFRNRHLRYRLR